MATEGNYSLSVSAHPSSFGTYREMTLFYLNRYSSDYVGSCIVMHRILFSELPIEQFPYKEPRVHWKPITLKLREIVYG